MADAARFFNREISWMQFNWRVLEEARNKSVPLLERMRFLAISGSNLDEFISVRVASLRRLVRRRSPRKSIDGRTAAEQLDLIDAEARELIAAHPDLATEHARSRSQFGPAGPSADPSTDTRHLEWFVAERHSPSLFGVPTERLGERTSNEVRRRVEAGETEGEEGDRDRHEGKPVDRHVPEEERVGRRLEQHVSRHHAAQNRGRDDHEALVGRSARHDGSEVLARVRPGGRTRIEVCR